MIKIQIETINEDAAMHWLITNTDYIRNYWEWKFEYPTWNISFVDNANQHALMDFKLRFGV